MNMKDYESYFASSKNPPKGYGSIEAGMQALGYRSERLKYWRETLGTAGYTPECFANAERDVVAKFGQPF
ncbi:hypothetical protein pf16_25 [Pseudomonas phage pf16]|uniref:Uncharacterized protein n=1 Tax=Pseudomonas phage pf16 TaxID=1815630 RepID=A0A1S5R3I0_9CAUD|nr:hypothetical protein FDG98_gp024 [Pseudomonas phage pf16]AND74948.1 hypothetical protein pf16_25 [Pseudomonas phage pf16]